MLALQKHICQQCNKLCQSKNQLQKHYEGVHEKKREFKCDSCEKMLCSKAYLQKHILRVHGDLSKTLKCNFCDKLFKTVCLIQQEFMEIQSMSVIVANHLQIRIC